MSRKPSIFSKNYKKKLRRRKRRIITAVIACIAVAVAGVVLIVKNMDFITGAGNDKELTQQVSNKTEEQNAADNSVDNEEKKESDIKSEEFSLESGNKVTVTYKEEDGASKIQMVDGGHSVKSSVSPENDQVLLCDADTKDIYLIGKDKKVEKITNPKYVATNNGGTFLKETVMASNPSYKWVDDGKFIDETHIAYTSALPWFNKENMLYLWIYNVEDGTHKSCLAVRGSDFEFGEINESGIKITVDGTEVTVNKDGNVAQ